MTLRKLFIREGCAICLNSAVDKILLTGSLCWTVLGTAKGPRRA